MSNIRPSDDLPAGDDEESSKRMPRITLAAMIDGALLKHQQQSAESGMITSNIQSIVETTRRMLQSDMLNLPPECTEQEALQWLDQWSDSQWETIESGEPAETKIAAIGILGGMQIDIDRRIRDWFAGREPEMLSEKRMNKMEFIHLWSAVKNKHVHAPESRELYTLASDSATQAPLNEGETLPQQNLAVDFLDLPSTVSLEQCMEQIDRGCGASCALLQRFAEPLRQQSIALEEKMFDDLRGRVRAWFTGSGDAEPDNAERAPVTMSKQRLKDIFTKEGEKIGSRPDVVGLVKKALVDGEKNLLIQCINGMQDVWEKAFQPYGDTVTEDQCHSALQELRIAEVARLRSILGEGPLCDEMVRIFHEQHKETLQRIVKIFAEEKIGPPKRNLMSFETFDGFWTEFSQSMNAVKQKADALILPLKGQVKQRLASYAGNSRHAAEKIRKGVIGQQLTQEFCLRCIADMRTESSTLHKRMEGGGATAELVWLLRANAAQSFDVWERATRAWFGDGVEPQKEVRMPFEELLRLCKMAATNEPEEQMQIDAIIAAMDRATQYRCKNIDEQTVSAVRGFRQQFRGKHLTFEECMNVVKQAHENEEERYHQLSEIAPTALVEILRQAHEKGVAVWEAAVREWFAQKKNEQSVSINRAPITMSQEEFQRISTETQNAQRMHGNRDELTRAMTDALRTMPDDVRRPIVESIELRKKLSQETPAAMDLEACLTIVQRAKKASAQALDGWAKALPKHSAQIEAMNAEFYAIWEQAVRDWFANRKSLTNPEVVHPVAMSRATFLALSQKHQATHPVSPEYQKNMVKRTKEMPPALQQQLVDAGNAAVQLQESLPDPIYESSLPAIHDLFAKSACAMTEAWREHDPEIYAHLMQENDDSLVAQMRAWKTWFAAHKVSATETEVSVTIPYDTFNDMWTAIVQRMLALKPEVDAILLSLDEKQRMQLQTLVALSKRAIEEKRTLLRNRKLTQQECEAFITEMREECERLSERMVEASAPERLREMIISSQLDCIAGYEHQIRSWFAEHTTAAAEQKEKGPIRMPKAIFIDINKRASVANMVVQDAKYQKKSAQMPPYYDKKVKAAFGDLRRLLTNMPPETSEEEMQQWLPRLQDAERRVIAPWQTYDEKMHAALLREAIRTQENVRQEVLTWFAERQPAPETSGEVTLSREEIMNVITAVAGTNIYIGNHHSTADATEAVHNARGEFLKVASDMAHALPENMNRQSFAAYQSEISMLFTRTMGAACQLLDPQDAPQLPDLFALQHAECTARVEAMFAEKERMQAETQKDVRVPKDIEVGFWQDMPNLINEQKRLAGELAKKISPMENQAFQEDKTIVQKQILAIRSRYPEALTRAEFTAYVAENLQTKIALFRSVEHSHASIWKLIKEAIERQFAEVTRRGMEWFDQQEAVNDPVPAAMMSKSLFSELWKWIKKAESDTGHMQEAALLTLKPEERVQLRVKAREAGQKIDEMIDQFPDPMTREKFLANNAATLQLNLEMFENIKGKSFTFWEMLCNDTKHQFAEIERRGVAWFNAHKGPEKAATLEQEEIAALLLDGEKALGIAENFSITLSAAGEQDQARSSTLLQAASRKLGEGFQALYAKLPPVIDDYNVVTGFMRERMGLYRTCFADVEPYVTPESYESFIDRAQQLNAFVLARVRAQCALKGTPVTGNEKTRKPDVITKMELGVLLKANPGKYPKLPEIRAAFEQNLQQQNALFQDLPSVIDDFQVIEEYHQRCNDAFGSNVTDLVKKHAGMDTFNSMRMAFSREMFQAQEIVRTAFALRNTPVNANGKRTRIPRWELGLLFQEANDRKPSGEVMVHSSHMDHRLKARFQACRSTQEEAYLDCPRNIEDGAAIEQMFARWHDALASLSRDIRPWVGDEQAQAIVQKERNMFADLRRELGAKFAFIAGTDRSTPSVLTVPNYEPTSELPKIVTREWVIKELLAADTWSNTHIVANLQQQGWQTKGRSSNFAESFAVLAAGLCPEIVKDINALEQLLYLILGQVEARYVAVPMGQRQQHQLACVYDKHAYNEAFAHICKAVTKKRQEHIPNIFDGIPTLQEYKKGKGVISTDALHTDLMKLLHICIKDFLHRRKKHPQKQDITRALYEYEGLVDAGLQAFCRTFVGDTAERWGAIQGIASYFGECLYQAQFWLQQFTSNGAQNKLFDALSENARSECSAFLQSQLDVVAPEEITYPPPALIKEPWSPKDPEEKSVSAEQIWKELLHRSLTRQVHAFVEACTSAGIEFPNEKRVVTARAILRTLFQELETRCGEAIARVCHGEQYGPHANHLAEAVTAAIGSIAMPHGCPEPLWKAFHSAVQTPLYDAFADGGIPLIEADSITLHDPSASWIQELEVLFTAREALPATEAAELRNAVEPVKQDFAATMLRSMATMVERRPSGAKNNAKIYAVAERNFSAEWIPVIQNAVSTTVDAYVTRQSTRSPTIRDFLVQHFGTVRQRTLFTQACSAVETRLKNLKDRAPSQALLTAMRRPIDPKDIDTLVNAPSADISEIIASEILGPRDTSLLPGELSLLRQFCRNELDFDGDIALQLEKKQESIGQLAQECIRSFHAGFPCRTAEQLNDALPEIAETEHKEFLLRRAQQEAAQKEKTDEKLPPHVAELARITDENALWIMEWPKGRKKDSQLGGFLQQVLHWQETATVFLTQFRTFGEAMESFEEARLCADSVAKVRTQKILSIVEAKALPSGRKRKGGLKMHASKFQALFDWRLERERALRTGTSAEDTGTALHPSARPVLEAVWQRGREMQKLEMQQLEDSDGGPSAADLQKRIAKLEDDHARALRGRTDVQALLAALGDWHKKAPGEATRILASVQASRTRMVAESTEAEAAIPSARSAVENAQQNLSTHTSGKRSDSRQIDALCIALASAHDQLARLESCMGTEAERRRSTLAGWEVRLQNCLPGEAASSDVPALPDDFETLSEAATAFIQQVDEWELYESEESELDGEIHLLEEEIAEVRAQQTSTESKTGEQGAIEKQLELLRSALEAAMTQLKRAASSPPPRP